MFPFFLNLTGPNSTNPRFGNYTNECSAFWSSSLSSFLVDPVLFILLTSILSSFIGAISVSVCVHTSLVQTLSHSFQIGIFWDVQNEPLTFTVDDIFMCSRQLITWVIKVLARWKCFSIQTVLFFFLALSLPSLPWPFASSDGTFQGLQPFFLLSLSAFFFLPKVNLKCTYQVM